MIDRKQLEYDIIGACIMENAYGQAVHLLRAKNFQQPECAAIWQVMSKIWPDHIINLHILSRKLGHLPKIKFSWQYHLMSITQHTLGSSDLVMNCYLLLEMDFTAKFEKILTTYRLETKDLIHKTVIDEILKEMQHPEADIFIILDVAYSHLMANGITDLAEDIKEMASHINTRARMIKNDHRKEVLLAELKKVEEYENELNNLSKNQTAA